ncbi:GSCOCG00012303001-RA-CDS, partial [Cotesia congregata]
VIIALLSLPFSNASVERAFSNLKKIKTDNRNKLNTETVSAIMITKNGLLKNSGCIKFEPSKKND